MIPNMVISFVGPWLYNCFHVLHIGGLGWRGKWRRIALSVHAAADLVRVCITILRICRNISLKVGIRSDLNEFPVLPSTRPQPLCKLLPMQALGVHDVNRPGAAGVKRKPAVDYTSVKRQSPPSVFYIRAAHARIVNDFPMFYKTEWATGPLVSVVF